jgi:5-methylcytosine-specific restriction endonuclease McrA
MTYSEKLKDPRWQKRKTSILQRDNFQCQEKSCLSTHKTLHVHHLDYIPGIEPWEYPDDMLITLCFECHEKEKDRTRLEFYLSNTLRMKGFLLSDLLALSCKIDTDIQFSETLLKVLRNG